MKFLKIFDSILESKLTNAITYFVIIGIALYLTGTFINLLIP